MFALLSLLPFLASTQAFFILTQPVLLTTRLDPIVDPGSVGGHVHTIAGGSNFDKWMDYGMSQASTCTTAPITVDKSNYWIPQLYYYNPATTGYQAIPVAYVNTYYLPRSGKNDTIRAFPDGLRMLSGDPNRRVFNGQDIDDQAISYVCLDYKGNHKGDPAWDQRNSFFNHNCPDGMRAQVNFPTCWDGKNLDSPDHRSHMAWPVNGNNNGGGDCPASHPVKVVQLFYEFIFEVQKFPFNPAGQPTWVWANGDATGYGLHADFINGWPALVNGTNVLQRAINECNADNGVGGNLQACPPFQGLINTASSRGCQPQNPLVAEDIGFGHEIPSLPGNNPLWIGNVTKPSIANYTEAVTEYATGRSILPTDWNYIGCTAEATSGRSLSAYQFSSPNMTRAVCAAECGKRGYPLAGTQFGTECRCDYRMRNGASNTTILPVERCNSKCSGLSTENCGGSMFVDLLVNPTLFPPPLRLQTGWEYQGCYVGGADGKRLLGGATFVSNGMTNEMCVKNCHGAGFAFGGSEWGSECRCSNVLPTSATKVSEDQCLKPCAGDARYGCGDGDRISLFKFTGRPEDAPGASTAMTPTANPAVPAGVDGWYKKQNNCVTEGSGSRALTGYSTANGQMSGAACITLCAARGFAYAGTEWTSECYCGSSINAGSKEAPASECNMPCSGASGEMCGGSNRLNMYYLNSTAAVAPATLPSNWVADGCWNSFGSSGKAFNGATVANSTINHQVCLGYCQANGFTYAGIEYGRECRCGMGYAPGSVQMPSSDCNMPCAGTPTQLCGAGNRMTAFRYTGTVSGPSNANIKVDGWTDKGCLTEGKTGRALVRYNFADGGMTVPMCLAACKARGWRLAGLEFSGECWCSEAIANGAVPTTEGCTMPCKGDKSTLCGGPDRINLFESTSPIPDPVPAGWASMGCITDDGTRTLRNFVASSSSMTVGSCISTCSDKGFKYAGIENGNQCFCDNTIWPAGKVAPDGECSIKCQGNSDHICGGAWRLSGYYNKAAGAVPIAAATPTTSTTTTAPAATSSTASAWTYRGCYTEGNGVRAVPNGKYVADSKNMSKAFCANYAQANNHTFYALTYYYECFTGNTLNTKSNVTAESECSYACSGAKGDICGGNNRASVYTLNGPAVVPAPVTTTTTTTTAASTAAPTAMPEGWSMTGCIVDGDSTGQRAFASYRFASSSMTWALCASTCAKNGYNMGGVSYGSECYCSNTRHPQAVTAKDFECDMKCSGEEKMCGGSWRLNMLAGPGASTGLTTSTTTAIPATTTTTASSTTTTTSSTSTTATTAATTTTITTSSTAVAAPTGYLGCFTDRSNRQLNGTNIFGDTKSMDNNFCVDYCTKRGFAIAGTTYGAECMCGNYLNRSDNVTLSDPNGCGMTCTAAGSTQKCGASWQLSVYLTGVGNATIYDQQRKREVRSRVWRMRD